MATSTPVVSADEPIPTPKRPWLATRRQRAETGAILVVAALIDVLVVQITSMKGKLAYVGLYLLIYPLLDYVIVRLQRGKRAAIDVVFRAFVSFAMAIAMLPILSILWTVWARGHKGLHWNLFTQDMHSASVTDPIMTHGGLTHAIIGSVLIVASALVFSVPIGLLTAIYLTEIQGRFTRPIKFLVQSMSGVPSIVAGLFILAAVVYPLTKTFNGFEGSLALAILMVPTIARTAEEVLLLIPHDLRETGLALGGTQWRTVQQVILPAARSGLVTAMILGIARVAGETAPIVLLTGGGDTTNWNLLHGPMGTLPFYIWKGFGAGTDESFQRAWTGILVLLVVVLVLFALARFLGGRRSSK